MGSVSSPDTATRHQTPCSINRLTKLEEDDVPDSDMEEYVGVGSAATENPHDCDQSRNPGG